MATIYRRGTAWVINWSEAGQQHRKSLGKITEAEAQAQLNATEARLSSSASAAAGPAFADWAAKYAAWHSHEYPDSYFRVEQILRTHLLPAFGHLPLMAIKREPVERYKHARLTAGAAPGTVTKELRTLQACLNHAQQWDIIPRNPIHGVRTPRDTASKPARWYSRAELALIYATELEIRKSTANTDADLHREYRWAWQLLANTGMRRGEIMHLRWADIGQDEIRILSESGARTKSGKWRAVPITTGANEALSEFRRTTAQVMPPIRPESLSRAFDRTTTRAGITGSIHCLRHTYCSHLVQAGVPLRTVQILAGHASYRTTERYAHLAPGHLQDAVKRLHL